MSKTTQLHKIRPVARTWLYFELTINKRFLLVVPKSIKDISNLDVNNYKDVKIMTDLIMSEINKVTKWQDFLSLIDKAYLPLFFNFINDLLSEKDYNLFLKEIESYSNISEKK